MISACGVGAKARKFSESRSSKTKTHHRDLYLKLPPAASAVCVAPFGSEEFAQQTADEAPGPPCHATRAQHSCRARGSGCRLQLHSGFLFKHQLSVPLPYLACLGECSLGIVPLGGVIVHGLPSGCVGQLVGQQLFRNARIPAKAEQGSRRHERTVGYYMWYKQQL